MGFRMGYCKDGTSRGRKIRDDMQSGKEKPEVIDDYLVVDECSLREPSSQRSM